MTNTNASSTVGSSNKSYIRLFERRLIVETGDDQIIKFDPMGCDEANGEFVNRMNKLKERGWKIDAELATGCFNAVSPGAGYQIQVYTEPPIHVVVDIFGNKPASDDEPDPFEELPASQPSLPGMMVQPTKYNPISDGTYTAVFADDRYKTIRVFTQPANSSFAPGKTVLSVLNGPDNERHFSSFGFLVKGDKKDSCRVMVWDKAASIYTPDVRDAVRIILQDANKAGEEYAMKSGRCCRCGRKLTVPASLHRGMGPECAGKDE